MRVAELITELQKMPPDAEVYYNDGPQEGWTLVDEMQPRPRLQDDGRVCL